MKLDFKENTATSKPLGERIFDAIFSSVNWVDRHLDGWGGGWCAEKLEKGILVGVKEDCHEALFAGWRWREGEVGKEKA